MPTGPVTHRPYGPANGKAAPGIIFFKSFPMAGFRTSSTLLLSTQQGQHPQQFNASAAITPDTPHHSLANFPRVAPIISRAPVT